MEPVRFVIWPVRSIICLGMSSFGMGSKPGPKASSLMAECSRSGSEAVPWGAK